MDSKVESKIKDSKKTAFDKFTEFIISKEYNQNFFLNYKTKEEFDIVLWRSKYKTQNDTYQHSLHIRVNSDFIEDYDECSEDFECKLYLTDIIRFNPEDNNIGEKLVSYIKNLKFNKYYGMYFSSDKTHHCIYNRISSLEIEKELFPEYFENMICSVCYDHTETKTNCGHLLCFSCWETIVRKGNCRCPQCRACIKVVNKECYDDECRCRLTEE